jgi:hypothetical protein
VTAVKSLPCPGRVLGKPHVVPLMDMYFHEKKSAGLRKASRERSALDEPWTREVRSCTNFSGSGVGQYRGCCAAVASSSAWNTTDEAHGSCRR